MKNRNPGPLGSIACMSQIVKILKRVIEAKRWRGEEKNQNKEKGNDSCQSDTTARVCASAPILIGKCGFVLMLL